jgi:DNA-binding IscR family transcriptional regulator
MEAIAKNDNAGRTFSEIADDLGINPLLGFDCGNKLARKGYVQKSKGSMSACCYGIAYPGGQ